jgi:pyridoxine kinase
MQILSIQSQVAWGHVGNAAAVFPLQRLGAEVWPVPTVLFSNHPGHGGFRGQPTPPELIRELVQGLRERGALSRCDAVLSGYLGELGAAQAVLAAVVQAKAANPRAFYCLDPVIGDAGRVYVRPGIPELLRDQALKLADIATPNQFELEWLSGHSIRTLTEARAAILTMQARGPRCVLVTSLSLEDTPREALDMLAAEEGRFWRLRTPRLPRQFPGAGDTMAALFLFHRLMSGSARLALEAAGSATHGLLRRTAEAGAAELLTVAAQDEFLAPSWRFSAELC